MRLCRIVIVTILTLGIGGAIMTNDAASTYNKSTIVGIDQAQRTITFLTMDGQTVTLPVSDPNILREKQVVKGDRVSIEIDLGNRITKITKLSEEPRARQTPRPDDARP